MNINEFPSWLEQQFLQWQGASGKRATLAQFAAYLDISAPLLSHYLNGVRKPSGDSVHKLARRLGPEVYSILGLQSPDPKLRFIARNWAKLSPQQQQQLLIMTEKLLKAGNEKAKSAGRALPKSVSE